MRKCLIIDKLELLLIEVDCSRNFDFILLTFRSISSLRFKRSSRRRSDVSASLLNKKNIIQTLGKKRKLYDMSFAVESARCFNSLSISSKLCESSSVSLSRNRSSLSSSSSNSFKPAEIAMYENLNRKLKLFEFRFGKLTLIVRAFEWVRDVAYEYERELQLMRHHLDYLHEQAKQKSLRNKFEIKFEPFSKLNQRERMFPIDRYLRSRIFSKKNKTIRSLSTGTTMKNRWTEPWIKSTTMSNIT